MSKFLSYFCASLSAFPLMCSVNADEGISPSELIPIDLTPVHEQTIRSSTPVSFTGSEMDEKRSSLSKLESMPAKKEMYVAEKPFTAFTGKVKGKKVRLRANADLDSRVVKELERGEMISIVGEKGDFYAVEAPENVKAYVFRSFVLDNVIEANRVNVRLEPDLEAPVISHLNSGDKIQGSICPSNSKWLEIAPPAQTRFYVAKEYIDNIGGLDVKKQYDHRKTKALTLLESAALNVKAEFRKQFTEIDLDRLSNNYQTLIEEYSDFTNIVEQAKEALATLQEQYVQKKIAYLETKSSSFNDDAANDATEVATQPAAKAEDATDKMKLWEPIEESLYLTWARMNEDRNLQDYYDDQKISAVAISGIVEQYGTPVKNKPGDFILRDKELPVAYVYSTQVNLQDLIGKKVTVLCSPRPNNHFAFPAYFVLSVE